MTKEDIRERILNIKVATFLAVILFAIITTFKGTTFFNEIINKQNQVINDVQEVRIEQKNYSLEMNAKIEDCEDKIFEIKEKSEINEQKINSLEAQIKIYYNK
jgi:peptidoglycan hydrolase CwlO-like protein